MYKNTLEIGLKLYIFFTHRPKRRTVLNSVNIIYWQVGDEAEFPSQLWRGGPASRIVSFRGGTANSEFQVPPEPLAPPRKIRGCSQSERKRKALSDPRETTKLDLDLTQKFRFRAGISLALAALNRRLPKAQFVPVKSPSFSEGKSHLSPPFPHTGTISCSHPLSLLGC